MTLVFHDETKGVLGWGNRDSLDIINLILVVSINGAIKTHVMYKCNLNSRQIQDYIHLLLKGNFLEKIDTDIPGRSLYKTTERGLKFMKAFAELSEIFGTGMPK